jgi:tetratricopeptide (TPR) repeat protein
MGFRARKSFSIAKGVRLNVSKSGVGVSAGPRGMRYSVHSSGRRTATVGVPGSGVAWQSVRGRGASAQPRTAPQATAPASSARRPTPGTFAPKGEKELYKAIMAADVAGIERVANQHANYRLAANFLVGTFAQGEGNNERAETWLRSVLSAGGDIADDPFVRKYLSDIPMDVEIVPGITADLPVDRTTTSLILAEALQGLGKIDEAIDVVEQIDEPTSYAAVSLAELYLASGRFDDVVDLTNGIENVDDITALLNAYRGSALRHLGHHDAAREALKEALRSKKRSSPILHFALCERAEAYLAQNRVAQARKDLERILADDASFPEIRERLERLPSTT